MHQRIVLTENVVAATMPALRQVLSQALESGAASLTLDMDQVQELDSVGLSLLIGTSMALQHAGGRLEVRNVRDDVFNILHSMRLDRHFLVHRRAAAVDDAGSVTP